MPRRCFASVIYAARCAQLIGKTLQIRRVVTVRSSQQSISTDNKQLNTAARTRSTLQFLMLIIKSTFKRGCCFSYDRVF